MGTFGIGVDKVLSESGGFVDVNTQAGRDYVRDACGPAMKEVIKAAKNTKALFNIFEEGWNGVASKNFESDYCKAVLILEKSLSRSFSTLVKQIASITNAAVDQDIHVVEKQ